MISLGLSVSGGLRSCYGVPTVVVLSKKINVLGDNVVRETCEDDEQI